MNSRNGVSKQFKFYITDSTGVKTTLTFSFKHNALRYFNKEKYLFDTIIDGSDKQKFLWAHDYFEIDWNELIVGEDSDKLAQVVNAERTGLKVELQPHIDVVGNIYQVFREKSGDGETEMQFSQIVNSRQSPGNQGVVLKFKTVKPSQVFKIFDPSQQSSVSAMTFEEYI